MDASALLATQRHYYDLRADDYMNSDGRSDRKVSGEMPPGMAGSLIDELRLTGDVLELACGNGEFTREIVRHARSVTALDGSARMLALNQERLNDPKVTYVHADIFDWAPERTFDVVFFGFWLSHVPPSSFDDFWALVRTCLAPGGRVAFVDEDDRATHHDDLSTIGGVPTARRTLSDGRTFDIVKVFWRPDELEDRLRSLGWDTSVRCVGETFLYGVGTRRPGTSFA